MSAEIESVISAAIADTSSSVASTPSAETTETVTPETPTAETGETVPAAGPSSDAPAKTPVVAPADEPVADAAPATKDDSLETLQQELAGKRDNRIPYSRVTKIVAHQVEKEVAPLKAKVQEYEAHKATYDNHMAAMQLADRDPEQFLALLQKLDPRYATLLKPQAPAQPESTKPQPDVELSDGRFVYSAEQQEKLTQWYTDRRDTERDRKHQEEIAALKAQYGPVAQDWENRQRQTALRAAAAPKVQAQLERASKRPGFTENQQAIYEAMTKDDSLTLEDAYIQVVLPKFQADRDKMRAELIAETRQKPRAAATPAATPAAVAQTQTEPESIEDVIKMAIRGAK